MIYCSFCCIYMWLDPGTYMIARFMSFYKPGVTCDLILAHIWLLDLCPFINRVLQTRLPVRVVCELSQSSSEPILAFIGYRTGVSPIDDSSQSSGDPILVFIGCKTGGKPNRWLFWVTGMPNSSLEGYIARVDFLFVVFVGRSWRCSECFSKSAALEGGVLSFWVQEAFGVDLLMSGISRRLLWLRRRLLTALKYQI